MHTPLPVRCVIYIQWVSYREGCNHGKRLGQPQLSTTDDDGTVCHPFSV
jgi:hypothetical protein